MRTNKTTSRLGVHGRIQDACGRLAAERTTRMGKGSMAGIHADAYASIHEAEAGHSASMGAVSVGAGAEKGKATMAVFGR